MNIHFDNPFQSLSKQTLKKWKWKCLIFKCYSSEELITLNILHEVVPTWYSFHSWVDWSNADKVSRKQHTVAGVRTVYLCSQKPTFKPNDKYVSFLILCSHSCSFFKWKGYVLYGEIALKNDHYYYHYYLHRCFRQPVHPNNGLYFCVILCENFQMGLSLFVCDRTVSINFIHFYCKYWLYNIYMELKLYRHW